MAKVTGTSVGRAKDAVTTGKVVDESPELGSAFSRGDVSLDQAGEIAQAEQSCPGVASELLKVASNESFQSLRDSARRLKLDAEQHKGLAVRQRAARSARSHSDELGMCHIHLTFQPHIGAPIMARAEAQAKRLYRAAKKTGEPEPFPAYLADAYAEMLVGGGKARTTRPELVVLVSHEVARRGWKDVRPGEVCKIPGVGPIAPEVARDVAKDAFLNGVVFDGTDLRAFKRWSRTPPVEVRAALELGEPPDFDGPRCTDCGGRWHNERDHLEPHVARGPASTTNLRWRCWPCHTNKTARDRAAGKLRPPDKAPPKERARRKRRASRVPQGP